LRGAVPRESLKPLTRNQINRLGLHDGDRPQTIRLTAIWGRKQQTIHPSQLWPVTNLSLKCSHLVAERQITGLCRRPDDNPPEQNPANRLQEIKHCRRIGA
jgi:hypothetical protein